VSHANKCAVAEQELIPPSSGHPSPTEVLGWSWGRRTASQADDLPPAAAASWKIEKRTFNSEAWMAGTCLELSIKSLGRVAASSMDQSFGRSTSNGWSWPTADYCAAAFRDRLNDYSLGWRMAVLDPEPPFEAILPKVRFVRVSGNWGSVIHRAKYRKYKSPPGQCAKPISAPSPRAQHLNFSES